MKKLNRKGFTLIELLAVIAILAILVVIAVPGVLEMFNKGREQAFKAQAQEIWKAAEQQYVTDSLEGTATSRYCYGGAGSSTKTMDLTGSKSVYYDISIGASGITSFKVTDGTYKYEKTSNPTINEVTATAGTITITCSGL